MMRKVERMTLRDSYAVHAMQGLLEYKRFRDDLGTSNPLYESIAVWSYKYADAMMAERRKKKS